MLLWFASNGEIKETLEYGQIPFAGTTDFQIFAHIDGLNLGDGPGQVQATATIKLYKPDLTGSSYPILLMTNGEIQFHNSIQGSNYFVDGEYYSGFFFDFNDFNTSEENEILLDTPGIWKAVITVIYNRNGALGTYSVQGTATFNVGGTGSEQETALSLDTILARTYLVYGDMISDKRSLIHEPNKIYATGAQGLNVVQIALDYAPYALNSGIVQRDNSGQILVKEIPASDNNATSKKYVDTALAGKRSTVSGSYLLYATDSTGAQSSVYYTKVTTTGSDSIVQRDNGQIKVLLTPVANNDATSKQYVEQCVNDAVTNVLTEQEAYAILSGGNI